MNNAGLNKVKKDMRSEQRLRVTGNQQASLTIGGIEHIVRMLDISTGGFAVLMSRAVAAKTMVKVVIDFGECGTLDVLAYPVNSVRHEGTLRYRVCFVFAFMEHDGHAVLQKAMDALRSSMTVAERLATVSGGGVISLARQPASQFPS